ncbi:MAG: IS256 family transposase [Candidatus Methylomirabilales bacterium]
MKRVFRIQGKGKVKDVGLRGLVAHPEVERVDTTVALIQALIPLGLQAAGDALAAEVTRLAGPRHSRTGGSPGYVRWSRERGAISLLDQKLPMTYQRVRDLARNQEVPLPTYQQLQVPRQADAGLFRKVLLGLSCRDYQVCAEAVPEAFGLSPSTVSRRFIRASAKKLQALQERRLEGYDLVALLLDGKTFAEDAMVMALGITLTGEKVLLGFVQTATENERVCAAFLRELVERGLKTEHGLLCVLDGAKGLRKAVQAVFGTQGVVQRCQWHKRENVLEYLPQSQRATWRRKLQAAYERPSYAEAKAAFLRLRSELRLLNESAVKSLDEGFEETLTLHRLGVFQALGTSLKTTNCLESIQALVGRRTGKVSAWRTSDQKHRWLAAALLDIEPRLRRIKGFRALPLLRAALQTAIRGQEAAPGNRAA